MGFVRESSKKHANPFESSANPPANPLDFSPQQLRFLVQAGSPRERTQDGILLAAISTAVVVPGVLEQPFELVDKYAHFDCDSFLKGEWPEKPLSERACSRQDVLFDGLISPSNKSLDGVPCRCFFQNTFLEMWSS